MNKIFFILLFFILEVFAGFMGLTKDTYIISVKKVPLFTECSVMSEKIKVLSYGQEVIEAEYKRNKEIPEGWLYVSFDEDKTQKGFILKSTLLSNSLYENFLQTSSKLVKKSDDGISKISNKNQTDASSSKKNKGFSEEEQNTRKIKKGFAEDGSTVVMKINKEESNLAEKIASIEISSNEINKFIIKGNLK